MRLYNIYIYSNAVLLEDQSKCATDKNVKWHDC